MGLSDDDYIKSMATEYYQGFNQCLLVFEVRVELRVKVRVRVKVRIRVVRVWLGLVRVCLGLLEFD